MSSEAYARLLSLAYALGWTAAKHDLNEPSLALTTLLDGLALRDIEHLCMRYETGARRWRLQHPTEGV